MGALKDICVSADVVKDIHADYFQWLCETICVDGLDNSYWILMGLLDKYEAYSIIDMDQNREQDGKSLRVEYATSEFEVSDQNYILDHLGGPCSALEYLIGLARNMERVLYSAQFGDRTSVWFWELIKNLGMSTYSDREFANPFRKGGNMWETVQKKLDRLYGRKYCKDGRGGLFPLKNATKDQRKVEVWYQMQQYLEENDQLFGLKKMGETG